MAKMAETNPNGANQYQLDPRQKLCWDFYIDPKSETFSNAYQSAMKAGYEETTALQITTEKWFTEKVGILNMLDKAEKNLDKFLDMAEDTDAKLRVKADVTKFVAERVGKEKYSTRTELTGKGGGAIEVSPEDKTAAALALGQLTPKQNEAGHKNTKRRNAKSS